MSRPVRITAIFIAVALGSLTVILVLDPMALVPHRPYGPWIFVRLLVMCALAGLGLILALGVEDDSGMFDEHELSRDTAMHWRAIRLAFLVSALATATAVGAAAFVDWVDRVLA